jgi:hypothetical protein
LEQDEGYRVSILVADDLEQYKPKFGAIAKHNKYNYTTYAGISFIKSPSDVQGIAEPCKIFLDKPAEFVFYSIEEAIEKMVTMTMARKPTWLSSYLRKKKAITPSQWVEELMKGTTEVNCKVVTEVYYTGNVM